MSRTRRGAAVLAGAVALAAAASSCASVREDDPDTLVVSTFAFATEEFMEVVGEPFEEETGIEVVLDTGTNAGRLTKLRINKEAPDTDVVLISDYYARIGADMGLFAEVDPADVPAMEGIWPWAVDPQGYGPAYTFQLLGMVYRTDLVDGVPDSWDDLGSGATTRCPTSRCRPGRCWCWPPASTSGPGRPTPTPGSRRWPGWGRGRCSSTPAPPS
ncbi:extracellular solute-binding protein [Nocardiopsis composta]